MPPLFLAISDTLDGSAPFILPFSSQASISCPHPYPRSIAQLVPSTNNSSISDLVSLNAPSLPTPVGTDLNSSLIRSFSLGLKSDSLSTVLISLTPQLISYPTPPGLTTPSCRSVAATPPTGNPYPS